MREHSGVPESERVGGRVTAGDEGIERRDPDPRFSSRRAWQIVAASLGALLLAILVAGILAISENNRVKSITEQALSFGIEVEDETSDVHIAILELRHIHRNIIYGGSSPATVADFDDAFAALTVELGELAALHADDSGFTQARRIREVAERYYADFRPAVARAGEDPAAFQRASDIGLSRLADMLNVAQEIDNLGDQLADESLTRIERALQREQWILSGLVLGVLVVGIVLALAAGRILAGLRSLYEREQQSRRDLARVLQSKTDFVADASHELRTPLAVILGNAETALANGGDAEQYRESLAAIADEAKRMGKLVDDLLFLARSDAGTPPLEKEYLPARWLVSRLVTPGMILARQRGSCLSAEIGGEGYLEADPGRIEQAVLILIDNAARHSPPDLCVTLASRVEGQSFAIEVADSGPGISPEELPLIFDRFYRVQNRRTRKKGGSGLGLSIARTIVASHGGRIDAESRVGEGTRMTILLPLAAPPDAIATFDGTAHLATIQSDTRQRSAVSDPSPGMEPGGR